MRTMKPNFAYINIAFLISIAVLTILSFLFYQRSTSHLRYSKQLDESYNVILALKRLDQRMLELENYSRGFMLSRDSAFLTLFAASRDSLVPSLTTLQKLFASKPEQNNLLQVMKSTISSQLNVYQRNNRNVSKMDSASTEIAVLWSKKQMDTFRLETKRIEDGEMKLRDQLFKNKQFYEKVFPGYFNIISLWAGIITLVSFYFIHREMGIRSRYQTELEKKVQELNRSNSELEQFAYIASHDLQEPMRKIRTFTDKLKFKFREELPTDLKLVVDRIEAAAKRMQELIHDMINFTGLITGEETTVPIDLNQVLERVLLNFSDITNSRKASISWDSLPTVQGDERQIKLLFRSLLDNALKFSKPNQAPNIKIKYTLVNGNEEGEEALKGKNFHKIIIEDKGIGFSNEFSEKIFMIFQRLHTQQSGYIGKGVGLAIVHRIMSNHNGMITARGLIDGGATFFLYFPAEQPSVDIKNLT